MDRDLLDISGKRVLLVGATGVLGRAFATELVGRGASLVLADRPDSDVIAFSERIGRAAKAVVFDLRDEASVVAGVERAGDMLGGFDAVVNNAAITSEGLLRAGDASAPFESYPTDVFRQSLEVNLVGTFLVAREAGRQMKDAGDGGTLVNISSVYGIVAPDQRIYHGLTLSSPPGYAASKAGVIGLTRWLASWWGDSGIRVNCIVPGGVFNDHDDRFAEAYGNRVPLGRMAKREELTGMLVYLVSDASSYCTGQSFVVDGGLTAW
jgi:NAD(P)-dependent dehydrogenase (short-subunit alcohol dehydrogenase family)